MVLAFKGLLNEEANGQKEKMAHEVQHSGPEDTVADNRRYFRVRLLSPLLGRLMPGEHTFTVREASSGGFSTESPAAFREGSQHMFEFVIPSGEATRILAVCRYSMQVNPAEATPRYVVGFEFLPQPTENLRLVLGAIAADAPY